VAKTALVNKANAKPKFKVRGYTRCQRCGRPHSVYRKFGLCRICTVVTTAVNDDEGRALLRHLGFPFKEN